MKKVLFATTALVATAGVASADIALSGSAEMGISGGEGPGTGTASATNLGAGNGIETRDAAFWTHVDVTFTLSGESDNGLTFGASVDLDEAGDAIDGDDGTDGVAIFVSGALGTLTMGDTDSALDFVMTEAASFSAGSIDDVHTSHVGYDGDYGDSGRYLRYDYMIADFGLSISVSPDENWAIGAKYSGEFAGGDFGVGIGYQHQTWNNRTAPGGLATALDIVGGGDGIDSLADDASVALDGDGARNAVGLAGDVTVLGFSGSVELDSGFSAAVQIAHWDFDPTTPFLGDPSPSATHYGIGIAYEFDAITVSGNYGMYDISSTASVDNISGYGLAAAYDFGGGLSAHVGYNYNDVGTTVGPALGGQTWHNYSFGLAMSF